LAELTVPARAAAEGGGTLTELDLYHRPYTLNPKPYTLNHTIYTLNPTL